MCGDFISTYGEGGIAEIEALNQLMPNPTRQMGAHTLHVMPRGTIVDIFPGFLDVNRQICHITSRLTISSTNLVYIDSPVSWSGNMYMVAGQPATGEEITASDVFLVNTSSVSYESSMGGYYYESMRVFGGVYNLNNDAVHTSLRDGGTYNPDYPQSFFCKALTSTESSGLRFMCDNLGSTSISHSGTWWTDIYRKSNNHGTYSYFGRVRLASAINSANLIATSNFLTSIARPGRISITSFTLEHSQGDIGFGLIGAIDYAKAYVVNSNYIRVRIYAGEEGADPRDRYADIAFDIIPYNSGV